MKSTVVPACTSICHVRSDWATPGRTNHHGTPGPLNCACPVHTREPSCPGNLRIVMSACGACSGWAPGMVTDPRPRLVSLLMIAELHPKLGTTDAPPLPQSSVFEGGGWCVARSSIPPSVYVCCALSLSTLHRLVHSPSFSFLFALQYVPINQSLGGKAMQ